MTERSVTIVLQMQNLAEIQNQMLKLKETTPAALVIPATASTKALGETAGAVKKVGAEVETVASSSVGKLSSALGNVQANVAKLAASFAGIAMGGAIAGIAYLGAAKTELWTAEVYKSIQANTRWGLSVDEVKARVASFSGVGYTTSKQMLENIQAAYTYGGLYAEGMETVTDEMGKQQTMGRGEVIAKAAAKVAFNYVGPNGESIDPAELIRTLTRKGPLRQEMKADIAMELGTDKFNIQLNSVTGRLNLLKKHYADALTDQPWKVAQNNMGDLQKSIGTAITGPMANVTKLFSQLVQTITKIPGGGALIGYGAIIVGLAGALSMLITVFGPLIAAMGALNVVMLANPVGIAIVGLAALAVILYTVEQKTHMFSNAWKQLGGLGGIGEGIMKWLKDVYGFIDAILKKTSTSGILKIALEGMMGPIGLLLKPLTLLVDWIQRLWRNSDTLNKLFTIAMTVWQKMGDFLSWLWNGIQGIWNWTIGVVADLVDRLRMVLPGAGYESKGSASRAEAVKEDKTHPGTLAKWQQAMLKGGTEAADKILKHPTLATVTTPTPTPSQPSATPTSQPSNVSPIPYIKGSGEDVYYNPTNSQYKKASELDAYDKAHMSEWMDFGKTHSKEYYQQQSATSTPSSGRSDKGFYVPEEGALGRAAGIQKGVAQMQTTPNAINVESRKSSVETGLHPSQGGTQQNAPVYGAAEGGLIQTKGVLIGHEGEPIIPAKISSSSRLQEVLTKIASGGSGGVGGQTTISLGNLNVELHVDKIQTPQDVEKIAHLISTNFKDKILFNLRNDIDNMVKTRLATMRG